MEELHATYKQLTAERNEKNKEMDRKKLEIEQTEKKVWVPWKNVLTRV